MMTNPVSILTHLDGNKSHAEVESFYQDIVGRLGQESPESFAESYQPQYRDRALKLYETYMVLVVDTLSILGIGGYGWHRKPTHEDGQAMVERQREFRAELIALDETKISILKAPGGPTMETPDQDESDNSIRRLDGMTPARISKHAIPELDTRKAQDESPKETL